VASFGISLSESLQAPGDFKIHGGDILRDRVEAETDRICSVALEFEYDYRNLASPFAGVAGEHQASRSLFCLRRREFN